MPNAEIIAYVPPRHTRACTHAPPQDSQHVFTYHSPCCSTLRGCGAVDMGFPACTAQILPFYSDDARNKAINLTQHHRMEPNCSVTLPWHCCESHGTAAQGCAAQGELWGADLESMQRRQPSLQAKEVQPKIQGACLQAQGAQGVNAILESLGPKAIFWTPWEQKSSAAPDPLQLPQPQGLDIT